MPNNVANQTKIQFLLDCLRAISANRPTPTLRMQRSRARALRYTMRWVEKVMLGKESTTLGGGWSEAVVRGGACKCDGNNERVRRCRRGHTHGQ